MKKLMTMLSAVALAFGVQAAGTWYSGTSFETVITPGSIATNDASINGITWSTQAVDVVSIEDAPYALARADYFTTISQTEGTIKRAASIKTTFGNPIFCSSTNTAAEAKAMGTVYVDTLIKPTICEDENITLDSSAKLAIWFKLDDPDNPTSTNLMITAGYLKSDDSWAVTNYDCGPVVGDAEAWQRFTVKSFSDITGNNSHVPGFVVFRNGIAVDCADAKCEDGSTLMSNLDVQANLYNRQGKLFPSAVQSSLAKTEISAIGFDGTGLVDDILFTDDEPSFAAPFKTLTLAWDEHVTGFTYSISDVSTVKSGLSGEGSEVIAVGDGVTEIVISGVTVSSGYVPGALEADGAGISVNGDRFSVTPANFNAQSTATIHSMNPTVTVTIGGNTKVYGNLADAFEAVNDETGAVTMQLTAGQTLTSAITLDGANLTGVTIDLNGQTITYGGAGYAITAAVPLTITDSTQEKLGGIAATQVVQASTNLVINAGTFTGAVTIDALATATVAISGGTFNGAVSATSATGFITGGTFATRPGKTLLAHGYVASGNGPYTVGIGTWEIVYRDSDETLMTGLEPTNYTFNTDVVLPTPEKVGYTFGGWEDEDGKAFTYTKGTTVDDLELYASWDAATYEITLNANGGSVSPAVTNYTVETAAFDLPIPTLADNTFAGWTNETITTAFTNFTPSVEAPASFTLFAKWVPNAAPVEPVAPGTTDITPPAGKTPADYADQINKDKATYISVPADASSDYLDLFKAAASGETVQIVFDEASSAYIELTNKVEAAVTAIPVATVAGKAAEATTEVAVPADNVKAGLWYSISSGSALGSMTEGNRTQATSSGVTLTAPTYSGSGFYKVLVNPKNK